MEKNNQINYVIGNALEPVGDGVKIIAHCCNCQGSMRAGIALAIKHKWPNVDKVYKSEKSYLGMIQIIPVLQDILVCNMMAQNLYPSGPDKIPLRYDALETCLEQLARCAEENNASIHAPRFGAALAGGSWKRIEKIINETLIAKGINVTIYDLALEDKTIGRSSHFNK